MGLELPQSDKYDGSFYPKNIFKGYIVTKNYMALCYLFLIHLKVEYNYVKETMEYISSNN